MWSGSFNHYDSNILIVWKVSTAKSTVAAPWYSKGIVLYRVLTVLENHWNLKV